MKHKNHPFSAETRSEDTIKITNQSGSSVYVLSSFNETDLKPPYESTLTLLLTAEGKETIADRETAIIPLKETYCSSSGETKPLHTYSLAFVNPSTLAPIFRTLVRRQEDLSYSPISITEQDKNKLLQARKFRQRFLAYPTAAFSVKFIALLNGLKEGSSGGLLRGFDLIDKYFQDSKLFNAVDYSAFELETSYEDSYAGLWVGNQEEFTFYFYSPSSKEERIQAPNFVGSLHFRKEKLSGKLIDPQKGYAISFEDDEGKIIPIKFEKGTFFADNDSDVIALQPTFITKSTLTSKSQDKEIIPTVNGEINGVPVIGVTVKQDLTAKPGTDQSWFTFWHPKDFQQWFYLFMNIIGIVFAVHMIVQFTSWAYRKVKGVSSSIREPTSAELENEELLLRKEKQATFEKLGGKDLIPSSTELEAYISHTKQTLANQYRYQETLLRLNILDEQMSMLEKMGKHLGTNRAIIDAFSKIAKSAELLKSSLDTQGVYDNREVEHLSKDIQRTIGQIEARNLQKIPKEVLDSLYVSDRNLQEIKESINRVKEQQKEIEEGKGIENEDLMGWNELEVGGPIVD